MTEKITYTQLIVWQKKFDKVKTAGKLKQCGRDFRQTFGLEHMRDVDVLELLRRKIHFDDEVFCELYIAAGGKDIQELEAETERLRKRNAFLEDMAAKFAFGESHGESWPPSIVD